MWAGRCGSASKSTLRESIPTSAAPASTSHAAAAPVRNGLSLRYSGVPQCSSQPVATRTARPRTSSPSNASGPMARSVAPRRRRGRRRGRRRAPGRARPGPARPGNRWAGVSRYVPVFATRSIRPISNVVPGRVPGGGRFVRQERRDRRRRGCRGGWSSRRRSRGSDRRFGDRRFVAMCFPSSSRSAARRSRVIAVVRRVAGRRSYARWRRRPSTPPSQRRTNGSHRALTTACAPTAMISSTPGTTRANAGTPTRSRRSRRSPRRSRRSRP